MIIHGFDYSSYKVYNPKTGDVIVDGKSGDNQASSLVAVWLDDCFREPIIKDAQLKLAWETFAEKFRKENDEFPGFEELYDFLETYDTPSWIAFKINSYSLACGPVWSTTMLVVNKEVIIEGLDEN